jgi:DNA replication regulator DPB11
MNLAKFFSKNTTHLLCPSGSGAKFDKACEWNVPVISMEWLSAVVQTGTIPEGDTFLVAGSPSAVRTSTSNETGKKPSAKGKERAHTEEVGFNQGTMDICGKSVK